jgi:RNA polymerase sigma-70 factor (ECF subfamily)
MDLQQEKVLIEQAKSDPEMFGKLYDQYYLQIFRYILKRIARVEVAQDVTSTVFWKALNNIQKFHWNGVPFSAWLYRIANNEIVNHFRKNGQRQEEVEKFVNSVELASPSPESELLEAEAKLQKYEKFLILHQSIERLPFRYQEVIVLRYFENKHIHEICEILGKREGTVKSLLHRGLVKLRDLVTSNATLQEISR